MAEVKSLTPGQTRISGRVQLSRRTISNGAALYRTLIKLPAPDAYSSPSTVEVRSQERIGQSGDDVALVVAVSGYPRSYNGKDDDGQAVKVPTAENVLSFVNFG